MKNYYPFYYKNFIYIANKCTDSCCKDWDVVIDDCAKEYYKGVDLSFGKKLCSVMTTDLDGDTVFTLKNGRCPFWNKNMLCDIYINLGKEHLCETCKNFPRIVQDYADFADHLLSPSCPEASRLMFKCSRPFDFYSETTDNTDTADYNETLMSFLLNARKATIDVFKSKGLSFSAKLEQCLLFNQKVQTMLDNCQTDKKINYFPVAVQKLNAAENDVDFTIFAKLFKRLDIMDKDFKELVVSALEANGAVPCVSSFETGLTNLALYCIYRYYLTGIETGNAICTVQRLVFEYLIIAKAYDFMSKKSDGVAESEIIRLVQQYSKEVEQSYENSELLETTFAYDADFSPQNLCKYLN